MNQKNIKPTNINRSNISRLKDMNNNNNNNYDNNNINDDDKMHSILALFYFTPLAFILALFGYFWFDHKTLQNSSVLNNHFEFKKLMLSYIFGGILALLLNWSELFIIKKWNALTLCVIGGIKLILVFLSSWILFNHKFNLKSLFGYILIFIGVMVYNYSKLNPNNQIIFNNQCRNAFNICKNECKNYRKKLFNRNNDIQYSKVFADFPEDQINVDD